MEDQSRNTGRYHDHAKRLATAEVNAAVDGLLDAGVEDILVIDGHGRYLDDRPVSFQQRNGRVRRHRNRRAGLGHVFGYGTSDSRRLIHPI